MSKRETEADVEDRMKVELSEVSYFSQKSGHRRGNCPLRRRDVVKRTLDQ